MWGNLTVPHHTIITRVVEVVDLVEETVATIHRVNQMRLVEDTTKENANMVRSVTMNTNVLIVANSDTPCSPVANL